MRIRRSTEIIDTMLRSISSGANKTHIMYEAYLSYSQLKLYLAFLEEKQLIVYEWKSQQYFVTRKGVKFMLAYERIIEIVPEINVDEDLSRRYEPKIFDGRNIAFEF